MQQIVNAKYRALFTKKPRYFILMGGRSGGRSTVASQFALAKLVSPEYFRCAVMRFVLGDVRNSIFQDILDRAEEQEVIESLEITENPMMSIAFRKNIIKGLGFRKASGDQKSKLKSLANFNVVIIEEADEVSEEDFMQLDDSLRTLKSDIIIILLLNPPHKNHWIIRRWFNLDKSERDGFYKPALKSQYKENTIFIHTTYRDNLININQTTIDNFKTYAETQPDHYWNMIEGLVSEGMRGRIFKDWKRISDQEFEELPYPSTYGLDFGFTNDPTGLIEKKSHNNKVYFRELIYETGLTNQRLSLRMEQLGLDKETVTIVADSAEPKSIEELRAEGWNVIASVKGQDSVRAGIDLLLSKEVYYTEGSTNLDTENQEYKWALDKNKEPINEPVDDFNHLMDAARYVLYWEENLQQPDVSFI